MNPTGKPVALITGAAQGIGRELALGLAHDYAIAAIDIQETGLRALAEQIPDCVWRVVDVADLAQLTAAVAHFGPIDLLVANAGVGRETSLRNYDGETVRHILDVNLVGVANSISAVIPGMIQRRRGHLVAMSSASSLRGLPGMWAYCASKAGVNALMDGIRVEAAPLGIAVTTVCPGWVRTSMTAPIAERLSDVLELKDAARRILAAIRARKKFVIFPWRTVWQLRLLNWLPRSWSDAILGRMMRTIRQD